MELLLKTTNESDPRISDKAKKELFPKDRHPQTANHYKDEWFFIDDKILQENIAYEMQYIEFLVKLYNDYNIYLTTESLLSKTIIMHIGSVVEAVIINVMRQWASKANMNIDRKTFDELVEMANDAGMLNGPMAYTFHDLRHFRNAIHLEGIPDREYLKYEPDKANEFLIALENFRLELSKYLK